MVHKRWRCRGRKDQKVATKWRQNWVRFVIPQVLTSESRTEQGDRCCRARASGTHLEQQDPQWVPFADRWVGLASFFTRGWRTRVVEHRPKISPAAAPKLVLLWVEAPARGSRRRPGPQCHNSKTEESCMEVLT